MYFQHQMDAQMVISDQRNLPVQGKVNGGFHILLSCEGTPLANCKTAKCAPTGNNWRSDFSALPCKYAERGFPCRNPLSIADNFSPDGSRRRMFLASECVAQSVRRHNGRSDALFRNGKGHGVDGFFGQAGLAGHLAQGFRADIRNTDIAQAHRQAH